MPLYHWDSYFLGGWGLGRIIVHAGNVEAARAKVVKAAKERYKGSNWPKERIKKNIATFENEIAALPTVIDCGVVFVPGSA